VFTTPKRGELYELEIPEGEIEGKEFFGVHAYVVVSVNAISENTRLAVVVPLTSPISKETGARKDVGDYGRFRRKIPEGSKIRFPNTGTPYSGESIALTEQVRVISIERFKKPAFGKLTEGAMAQIELGLAWVQGIPAPATRAPVQPASNRAKRNFGTRSAQSGSWTTISPNIGRIVNI
jgi:mRNA-degrading endonuclease toxin of MazEF toxin-antitoxin module